MAKKGKKPVCELADEMKEPLGVADAGALAIAAVHEVIGRIPEKARKLARRARPERKR